MFSFYAKQVKKQCFLKVLKEKKLFQTKKTWAQKTPQNGVFTKGLVHGLCKKNGDFYSLVFMHCGLRKRAFSRFRKKRSLFRQKNVGSKNHQNMHCFKGVSPWFLAKNGGLLILTFYSKWNKKQCFLKIPKEKKPFQSKKTSAQKSTKICIFSKGLVHDI